MSERKEFKIFRFGDAPLLGDTDLQPLTSVLSAAEAELWERKLAAGYNDGQVVHVVVRIPGLTILRIWNKAGYPTPLHTHDVDCLYYLLAGSASFGAEKLEPGDSFFVPANMPYTYKVGPEGAEVLEIRQADNWDLKLLARNPAYFDKAVASIAAHREAWQTAERPSARP